MHYFLTGERQVGKSTIINRIVKETGFSVGGFKTSFGADRFTATEKKLYMYDAAKELIADEDHIICQMSSQGISPRPEQFDKLGTEYIRRGLQNNCQLLIMDECGRLEKDAEIFRTAVIETLDTANTVLGVIQIELPEWTKAIYLRSDVELITVTKTNRDEVAERLIKKVKELI